MKETIEYLKKDRKVNDTFMKKLQKVGFEIVDENEEEYIMVYHFQ